MRVMSKKQEVILHNLLRLARGDSLLVERAIRLSGNETQAPTVDEVVSYIKSETAQKKSA